MSKFVCTLAVAVSTVLGSAIPASARPHRASIPTGYYQCYETRRDVSPINGEISYSTIFVKSFTLFAGGTYNVPNEGLFNRDNHWKFSSPTLHFSSGPMWEGFRHAIGAYNKAGSLMANSTLNPTQRYPLVLRDARSGDSDSLPQKETADATLWYCKKR